MRTFAWVLVIVAQIMSVPAIAGCEQGRVGELLCNDPDVKKLDTDLNAQWARIICSGPTKAEFVAEQKFWLRERNNCNNVSDVRSCLIGTINGRISFLKDLTSCEDPKRVVRYNFVDPWHVLQHPNLYANTNTHVFGWVALDSCRLNATSLLGMLHGEKPHNVNMKVVFKSMASEQREFLCTRSPYSYWQGTIKLDSQGPYLYLVDILGVPLP